MDNMIILQLLYIWIKLQKIENFSYIYVVGSIPLCIVSLTDNSVFTSWKDSGNEQEQTYYKTNEG